MFAEVLRIRCVRLKIVFPAVAAVFATSLSGCFSQSPPETQHSTPDQSAEVAPADPAQLASAEIEQINSHLNNSPQYALSPQDLSLLKSEGLLSDTDELSEFAQR